jgi:hypothetical protein
MSNSDEKLDAILVSLGELTRAIKDSRNPKRAKPDQPGPSGLSKVSANGGASANGAANAKVAVNAAVASSDDDSDLELDPRVSMQRQAYKRASIVLQGIKPVQQLDNDGQPIIPTPLVAPVANYSLQQPELFKDGQNIEDWLKRMRQYVCGNGLTDPTRIAGILGNRLSADVHSALNDMQLADTVWATQFSWVPSFWKCTATSVQ